MEIRRPSLDIFMLMGDIMSSEIEIEEQTKQVTLDDIESYVKVKDLRSLVALFSDKRDIRNIRRLFYYYDGRTRKKTNVDFLFKDDEYIVMSFEGGFERGCLKPYHSVIVIGFDEQNNPFTHLVHSWYDAVPEGKLFDREWLMNALDFESDDLSDINSGKRVRLQGDVVIRKRLKFNLDEWLERQWKDEFKTIKHKLGAEVISEMNGVKFKHWYGDASYTQLYRDEFGKELLRYRNISTGKLKQLKTEIAKQDNIEIKNVSSTKIHDSIRDKCKEHALAIAKVSFDKRFNTKLAKFHVEQKKKEYIEKLAKAGSQRNRILGNHLIVMNNVLSVNHSGLFVVNGKSKVSIIHNYHTDFEFEVDTGMYEFSTLRRNRKDVKKNTTFDYNILHSKKSDETVLVKEIWSEKKVSYLATADGNSEPVIESTGLPLREPTVLEEYREWFNPIYRYYNLENRQMIAIRCYKVYDYSKGYESSYDLLFDEMFLIRYQNGKLVIDQVDLCKPLILDTENLRRGTVTNIGADYSD